MTEMVPSQPIGALGRFITAVDEGMPPALALMLDDKLFDRVQAIALKMAGAVGFVPGHCVNKPDVCFAVATRAIVWKLDPFAVAQATYQPAEGAKVSYEGKLVQAILEQSGRFVLPIKREYVGDWSKVQGKFVTRESQRTDKEGKPKKYQAPGWSEKDEDGLGIIIRCLVKGEAEPREISLDLRQCHPRNSTLWATDPMTQIYYRAIRMFGFVACPGILMGVPFDDDEDEPVMKNITPESERPQTSGPVRPPAEEQVEITGADGEVFLLPPGPAKAKLFGMIGELADGEDFELLWKANADLIKSDPMLRERMKERRAEFWPPEQTSELPPASS